MSAAASLRTSSCDIETDVERPGFLAAILAALLSALANVPACSVR
jgi:hypothetical protein